MAAVSVPEELLGFFILIASLINYISLQDLFTYSRKVFFVNMLFWCVLKLSLNYLE